MENALVSMAAEFSGLPMDALISTPLTAAVKANAAMALTQTRFTLDTCFTKVLVPAKALVAPVPAVVTNGVVTTPEVIGTPAIPAHDSYQPIMITMALTRNVITPAQPAVLDADGTSVLVPATATVIQNMTTAFNLPLLTIVPINSLAVQSIDINFEMEVKSSFAEDTSEKKEKEFKAEVSFEGKVGYGPFSASMKASASYDQKDSSTHDTHYQKSNSAKYTVAVHAGQLPNPKGINVIIEAFANAIQPITLSIG